jgi:hypothetical protein
MLVMVTLCAIAGCASEPKNPPPPPPSRAELFVKHHTGGTHYRTIVHQGHWYQTFGTSLLVIKPDSGAVVSTVELGEFGKSGPATDMAILGDRMLVLIEEERIVELSLANLAQPGIRSAVTAAELGVEPVAFSMVDGELMIGGRGAVVRWSDRQAIARFEEVPSSIVRADKGLVATIGQQIMSVIDKSYVGAASMLAMAEPVALHNGAMVCIRQGPGGATAGLLSRDLVELRNTSVAVQGTVHRVRQFGGRVWIVSDREIVACRISGEALTDPYRIDVLGAQDVDRIDDNHLAIAGSFGRSIYRIVSSSAGPGDTFLATKREASALLRARSDPQRILAGSEEGAWLYLIGTRAEPSTLTLETATSPFSGASFPGTTAKIEEDGRTLTINTGGKISTHQEPRTMLRCLLVIEGNIWIGHDRGITVMVRQADQTWIPGHRLRLPGSVIHFRALLAGGGAAFVSSYGGFGVAEFKHIPLTQEEIKELEKQKTQKQAT